MLENRPDWIEYKKYCNENNIEISLMGFVRWSANVENSAKRFKVKLIGENQQFLNDVCRS